MTTGKDMRVVRLAAIPAIGLSAVSRTALDRPLACSAELVVAVPADDALILGAMQRFSEVAGANVAPSLRVTRRGSGGAEVNVGPGTVWIQLSLSSSGALVPCEPDRLVNRYVRPLLRAIGKVGTLAHYFDRDWVSASIPSAVVKRDSSPVASVAFAHDATTGRALFEALVAVTTPMQVRERASFLGKAPRTLRELGVSHEIGAGQVADAVIDAYTAAYGIGELSLDTASEMTLALSTNFEAGKADDPRSEPSWSATREEAIGLVAAGRDRDGRIRIGGELMASRDVIARVEAEIAAAAGDGARIDRAVDSLAAPGVAMLGVRSLRSIRDVIEDALAT